MLYRCTRAEQRDDGRFHVELEGPTFLDPPLPTPRITILHPVAPAFLVGGLYELAVTAASVTMPPRAEVVPPASEGHTLPLVKLAIAGSVTPPVEG